MSPSSKPKGLPITPAFKVRLERAVRGRTHTDLFALIERKSQSQHVGRALQDYPLTRPIHDLLEEAVQAAERLDGGDSNVGTPAVVAGPAPARPVLREVTSRSVLEAAIDELGAVEVFKIAAEVLSRAS